MAAKSRIKLPGSERRAMAGAKAGKIVDPADQIEVTVRIRGRAQASSEDLMKLGAQKPAERRPVSREEFAERFGADPADFAKVEAFAHDHGLAVSAVNPGQRTMRLKGSAAGLSEAFGVELRHYATGGAAAYRGRTGSIYIPKELKDIIVGVHGLDNRPVAKPHSRWRAAVASAPRKAGKAKAKGKAAPAKRRQAADPSVTAPQVAALYNFPTGLTGQGQSIALIELNDVDNSGKPTGAGYQTSDLAAYFKGLGIAVPTVVAVSVDGGANVPGPDPGSDGEVTLDIEVAGAVAPGATIAVYFAPNTTDGFIDALNQAVHDTVRKPSVISISWGGPEDPGGQVDQQFTQGLNQAIQDAAQLGVTVCCAAGDDGSPDMALKGWDGKPHADFPSSSPFALACGGTKLSLAGGAIASEVVWNEGQKAGAGGGGVSDLFALPSYQAGAKVPKAPNGSAGRGLPDLAGNADPETGYQIFLAGSQQVIGGTSAVAPLMAGLIALINQSLAKKTPGATAGFLNPLLYGSAAPAFRDITTGNNDVYGKLKGLYTAGPGWDACSGLGVPDGTKLLASVL
ncbi:MAG: S53 family peptidase [Bryobacteraceae bacterium]|jgi:kumamolisin